MAQQKIVWTKKANIERKEILEYWIDKNKSARFSKKLNLLFVESLKQICIYPNLGRKTSDEKTKVIIVRNYLIFYEFNEKEIIYNLSGMADATQNKKPTLTNRLLHFYNLSKIFFGRTFVSCFLYSLSAKTTFQFFLSFETATIFIGALMI